MSSRMKLAEMARQTLEILEQGFYLDSRGRRVSFQESMTNSIRNTVHYSPDMFPGIIHEKNMLLSGNSHEKGDDNHVAFEVLNESTITATHRLIVEEELQDVACLNFASALHPGGGFKNGSRAQEESLARCSGLYPCIVQKKEMYASNLRYKSCLYTDNMIFSPRVPVFRDDEGSLLDGFYEVSIITAPAVNAGCVKRNEPHNINKIESTMITRIEKILSIARLHSQKVLVLGAWGCGVFQNDPVDVSRYFKVHLVENPAFNGAFKKVCFAILDGSRTKATLNAFRSTFS
ncbi:MAG: TIGR02452 family protein [Promethearchaeota archaeon]